MATIVLGMIDPDATRDICHPTRHFPQQQKMINSGKSLHFTIIRKGNIHGTLIASVARMRLVSQFDFFTTSPSESRNQTERQESELEPLINIKLKNVVG